MAYPNGTMGCPDPAHRGPIASANRHRRAWARRIISRGWLTTHRRLSEHQRERMAALLPAPDPVLQIGDLSCPGE
jgi:hypothetical protein